MLNSIKKIPAGTFLVPMIVSMVLVSIFPNMYDAIGGTTQATFQNATGAIIGFMVFAAGTGLDLKEVGPLLRRHGPLIIFKILWSALLTWLFIQFFPTGVAGISVLAFTCVMFSINPAVAMAIHSDYGDPQFGAVYGLYGLLGMSFLPLIFLSFFGPGAGGDSGMDWTPIISIFIPLIAGIALGNIDKEFAGLFTPLLGGLLPFLGWNLGAGMNIQAAIQSGLPGILMTVLFLIAMLGLFVFDNSVTKNNHGIDGLAIWNVAGVSVANPAAIAAALPQFSDDVASATAIVMMACIITSILSPIVAKIRYEQIQA